MTDQAARISQSPWPVGLLTGQGLYYMLTGLWPIISIRSFEAVTGPKTDHLPTGRDSDHWLIMTVSVLVLAIAFALLIGAWKRRATAELKVLAIAAALGLAAIDVIYVVRQVIAPVYLIDAVIEAVLLLSWLTIVARRV